MGKSILSFSLSPSPSVKTAGGSGKYMAIFSWNGHWEPRFPCQQSPPERARQEVGWRHRHPCPWLLGLPGLGSREVYIGIQRRTWSSYICIYIYRKTHILYLWHTLAKCSVPYGLKRFRYMLCHSSQVGKKFLCTCRGIAAAQLLHQRFRLFKADCCVKSPLDPTSTNNRAA